MQIINRAKEQWASPLYSLMYLRNELDCHLPIFLIVSYDTPLLANHEAAPIRKECVLKCVVGRFRAVIALFKTAPNWYLVRGCPLIWQKRYTDLWGLILRNASMANNGHSVDSIAGMSIIYGFPVWLHLALRWRIRKIFCPALVVHNTSDTCNGWSDCCDDVNTNSLTRNKPKNAKR